MHCGPNPHAASTPNQPIQQSSNPTSPLPSPTPRYLASIVLFHCVSKQQSPADFSGAFFQGMKDTIDNNTRKTRGFKGSDRIALMNRLTDMNGMYEELWRKLCKKLSRKKIISLVHTGALTCRLKKRKNWLHECFACRAHFPPLRAKCHSKYRQA